MYVRITREDTGYAVESEMTEEQLHAVCLVLEELGYAVKVEKLEVDGCLRSGTGVAQ